MAGLVGGPGVTKMEGNVAMSGLAPTPKSEIPECSLVQTPGGAALRSLSTGILFLALALLGFWGARKIGEQRILHGEIRAFREHLSAAQGTALQSRRVVRVRLGDLPISRLYRIEQLDFGVERFQDHERFPLDYVAANPGNWLPVPDHGELRIGPRVSASIGSLTTVFIRPDGCFVENWRPSFEGVPMHAAEIQFRYGTTTVGVLIPTP